MADNEKQCTKCGRLLPIGNFWRNSSKKDGYLHICKECFNKYYYSKERNTGYRRAQRQSSLQTGNILRYNVCSECSLYRNGCKYNFDIIKNEKLARTCIMFKK